MKYFIGLLLIILTISILSAQAEDLFISEYVEGSSYNKAIEIFNGTGETVNLSSYSLKKQTNGSGDFSNELMLEGNLANEDVFVIVNGNDNGDNLADSSFVDMVTSQQILSFNGNDAVALCFNSEPIDIVGVVDSDEDWGKNMTLVRQSYVEAPTTNYNTEEWIEYEENNFAYLGFHEFDGGTQDPTIIVTSPNGGEEWEQGSVHNITWTSLNFDDNVKIELEMVYSKTREVLVASTENDGSWEWNIPEDQEINEYYVIIISDADDDDPWDESDDTFSIIEEVEVTTYTIYEIQYSEDGPSPHVDELVSTSGVVTAVFYNQFFIQDGVGAWNGICVYPLIENVTVGDSITIEAIVTEYNGKTELTEVSSIENHGQTALPEPETILTGQISMPDTYNPESWEGVLVKMANVTVTNDDLGYGEWEIDDGIDTSAPCRVDDLGEYTYQPNIGDFFYSITGIVEYSYENFKLEPRTDNDLNTGGIEVSPTTLEFYTYESTEGLNFIIYNYSDSQITINSITQSGSLSEAMWEISPWEIELPYILEPMGELELTVVVALPVDFNSKEIIADTLFIESDAGNEQVTILFDTDLISSSENNNIIEPVYGLSNYPNPFNPQTTIHFETVDTAQNIDLTIYNLKGQIIKQFVDLKGKKSVIWNGLDEDKNPAASGIYLYELKVDGKISGLNKMILLK